MSETLRILCVFAHLDRGGAETMCMNLYREIDRDRIQFDFVKHSDSHGDYEDEIVELGGRIYSAPVFNGKNYKQYKQWWMDHFDNHPEHLVIHGHYFTISPVYFRFAHKKNRICIAHCHSAFRIDGAKAFAQLMFIRQAERYADYCFSCSSESGHLMFPHKPFRIFKNAIDVHAFKTNNAMRDKVRGELGIDKNSLVIGTVGRFMPVKNPDGILDIFKTILGRKENAVLLWVGDGPLRKEIDDKVRFTPLKDHVILTGIRNDIASLMQAMDTFILPSFFEGFPVTLVEAQAAGLKCFVSNAVTVDSNITGNVTYLPINDCEMWANSILSSDLTPVDTTAQMITAGYDIKTSAKWIEEFYFSIIE